MKLADLLLQNVAQAGNVQAATANPIVGAGQNSGRNFGAFLSRAELGGANSVAASGAADNGARRTLPLRTDGARETRADSGLRTNAGRTNAERSVSGRERSGRERNSEVAVGNENDNSAGAANVGTNIEANNVRSENADGAVNNVQNADNAEQANVETTDGDRIAQIAELLGITPEAVQQIFYELGIDVSELTPNEIRGFVQKLFGVESAGALLAFDGAAEVIAALEALIDPNANVKNAEAVQQIVRELLLGENVQAGAEEFGAVLKETANAASSVLTAENTEGTERTQSDANNAAVNKDGVVAYKVDAQAGQFSQNGNAGGQQQNAAQLTQQVVLEIDGQPQANTFNNSLARTADAAAVVDRAQTMVSTADVINQIVERMKIGFRNEISEITIRLRPEHLGDLSMKITSRDGSVAAQIVAGTEAVRVMLESQLYRLRDALAEQGIVVDEINVSVGQNEGNQGRAGFMSGGGQYSGTTGGEVADVEEGEDVQLTGLDIDPNSTVNYVA